MAAPVWNLGLFCPELHKTMIPLRGYLAAVNGVPAFTLDSDTIDRLTTVLYSILDCSRKIFPNATPSPDLLRTKLTTLHLRIRYPQDLKVVTRQMQHSRNLPERSAQDVTAQLVRLFLPALFLDDDPLKEAGWGLSEAGDIDNSVPDCDDDNVTVPDGTLLLTTRPAGFQNRLYGRVVAEEDSIVHEVLCQEKTELRALLADLQFPTTDQVDVWKLKCGAVSMIDTPERIDEWCARSESTIEDTPMGPFNILNLLEHVGQDKCLYAYVVDIHADTITFEFCESSILCLLSLVRHLTTSFFEFDDAAIKRMLTNLRIECSDSQLLPIVLACTVDDISKWTSNATINTLRQAIFPQTFFNMSGLPRQVVTTLNNQAYCSLTSLIEEMRVAEQRQRDAVTKLFNQIWTAMGRANDLMSEVGEFGAWMDWMSSRAAITTIGRKLLSDRESIHRLFVEAQDENIKQDDRWILLQVSQYPVFTENEIADGTYAFIPEHQRRDKVAQSPR